MSSPLVQVAKREFVEHILSWRSIIAFVLSTLILVTSVIALTAAYQEDVAAYNQAQNSLSNSPDSADATTLEINKVMAKPNVLDVFVGGPGAQYRNAQVPGGGQSSGATFSPANQAALSGKNSPTNTRFSPLDLGFVSIVVMTFMAVIFSFDSVSGEKERGTLKLMLANPVPKDSVLLGKYLGGMASILLPFAVSLLISLAVFQFTGTSVPGEAWGRIVFIFVLAVLLVSAFYLLGLFVSSLCKRSSTSLLALVLVWLVLVFAVGNVAGVASKAATPSLTPAQYAGQVSAINDAASAKTDVNQPEIDHLVAKQSAGNLSADEQARLTFLQAANAKVDQDAILALNELGAKETRKLDDQLRNAESLAVISPVESFRSLSTSIARSDYWDYRAIADAGVQYQNEIDRLTAEYAKTHPAPANGGPSGFVPPHFQYNPASLDQQVSSGRGLRDLGSLLAFNLMAFGGAYVAFLRYDVR